MVETLTPPTVEEKEPVKTLKDISALAGLKDLETLTITGNAIKDISVLTGLKSLKTLNGAQNEIEKIGNLAENMPKLETLNLSDNKLADISGIKGLSKLASVDFSENKTISDVSVFAEFDPKVLKTVNISENSKLTYIGSSAFNNCRSQRPRQNIMF